MRASVCACVCACMCACVRAGRRVGVRAGVRAWELMRTYGNFVSGNVWQLMATSCGNL